MSGGADGHVIGVAVPIPEPWGQELADARKLFGDPMAGLIPPHITLLPPTTLDDAVFVQVEDHLREVAAEQSAFEVHLRGTGSFLPVSPVIFLALAGGISDFERLEQGVRRGPLERELHFPYHPHVTVAHDLPSAALQRAYDELADYESRFRVGSFQLYEHGDGGVWRSLREFWLVDAG
ncbi:MAG: 2'-5' RNA ligase family protein [Actinomycetes bacterium]